jgi:hypothetical protein
MQEKLIYDREVYGTELALSMQRRVRGFVRPFVESYNIIT